MLSSMNEIIDSVQLLKDYKIYSSNRFDVLKSNINIVVAVRIEEEHLQNLRNLKYGKKILKHSICLVQSKLFDKGF